MGGGKWRFCIMGVLEEGGKMEGEEVEGGGVVVMGESKGGMGGRLNVMEMKYWKVEKVVGGRVDYKKEEWEKKSGMGWRGGWEVVVMEGGWEVWVVWGERVVIGKGRVVWNGGGKVRVRERWKIEVRVEVGMGEEGWEG